MRPDGARPAVGGRIVDVVVALDVDRVSPRVRGLAVAPSGGSHPWYNVRVSSRSGCETHSRTCRRLPAEQGGHASMVETRVVYVEPGKITLDTITLPASARTMSSSRPTRRRSADPNATTTGDQRPARGRGQGRARGAAGCRATRRQAQARLPDGSAGTRGRGHDRGDGTRASNTTSAADRWPSATASVA